MRFFFIFFIFFISLAVAGTTLVQTLLAGADDESIIIRDRSRIVTIGGSITEIVYALGQGSNLVGVDTSSIYPESTTHLPKVGYQRALSAEGILSLRPSLILATPEAGPLTVIAQLKASGIPVLVLPVEYSVEGARNKIRYVAKVLGVEAKGEELIRSIDQDLRVVEQQAALIRSKPPKVLFIYARGQGTLLVSGRGTAADGMIKLARGINAITDYEGFKPLTAEAAIVAAPDVLLLPSRGLESIGGVDGLFRLPGLSLTPAGKNRRFIAMDDLYLLGFGPRVGRAIQELMVLLYPELGEGQRQ
ncbi:MAG TPA: hemin ABC transporter substrate-binding protein [Candidatus Limnocylindrales bacterium]|nr:hemin ABC transporter substrate-binding protein [Candidatus Limnocylindrales bacterium]